MSHWSQAFKPLLGLFLASKCPLCQRSAIGEFCLDCGKQIQRCQISQPEQFWQGTLPVFVWGAYSGTLKRSIVALKYDHQPQVAQPLGQWLGQAWIASPLRHPKPLMVVPIPMYAEKQQQRGYNQAELLARSFCQVTGLPLQAQGLARVRATEAQFGLSIAEREQNLTSAFRLDTLPRRSRQTSVLLLDDIYTTGATVRAAAQTLLEAGIAVSGVVAIAKAMRS